MRYEIIGEVKDPISVEEAKAHLRVISRSDDTYIAVLVRAAREMAEAFLGRAISHQTVREYFNAWPCDRRFTLSVNRFRTLENFSYIDTDGFEQELDTNNFYLDTISIPGVIKLKETETFPRLNQYDFNTIKIEYTAGFDTSNENEEIPSLLIQGMKEHIADMYVNRTPVNLARDGRIAVQIPAPIQRLYGPFRARA